MRGRRPPPPRRRKISISDFFPKKAEDKAPPAPAPEGPVSCRTAWLRHGVTHNMAANFTPDELLALQEEERQGRLKYSDTEGWSPVVEEEEDVETPEPVPEVIRTAPPPALLSMKPARDLDLMLRAHATFASDLAANAAHKEQQLLEFALSDLNPNADETFKLLERLERFRKSGVDDIRKTAAVLGELNRKPTPVQVAVVNQAPAPLQGRQAAGRLLDGDRKGSR